MRLRGIWYGLVLAAVVTVLAPLPVSSARLSCTFTVTYPVVTLREGPGTEYTRTGFLEQGDTAAVIDQSAGKDGYVWWKTNDGWVRSDLGTSDCPATCGNTVCETGETSESCAKDCGGSATTSSTSSSGSTTTTTSSDAQCVVNSCQSCYESISCYPDCSECTCTNNAFGCATCYCSYPSSTSSTSTTGDQASSCQFKTCEECIAAFPCNGGACKNSQCNLNEWGCPVCTTSN